MRKKLVIGNKWICRNIHREIYSDDYEIQFNYMPAYVCVDDSINRHISIDGISGVGKSFLIYKLILQNIIFLKIPTFAIDTANCFFNDRVYDTLGEDKRIWKYCEDYIYNTTYMENGKIIININPFSLTEYKNGSEILKEIPAMASARITEIFTPLKFGRAEKIIVFNTIEEMLTKEPTVEDALCKLYNLLNKKNSIGKNAASKLNILSKLVEFRSDPKNNIWSVIIKDKCATLNIFQLSQIKLRELKKIAADFIQSDLINYMECNLRKNDRFTLIFDEIQNININNGSPITKLLTEGRKFGAGIWYATQSQSSFKSVNVDESIFKMAATIIHFKPDDKNMHKLSKHLSEKYDPADWGKILSTMKEGCCIVEDNKIYDDPLERLVIAGSILNPDILCDYDINLYRIDENIHYVHNYKERKEKGIIYNTFNEFVESIMKIKKSEEENDSK
ncbi:MAG: ATP-binding protein [Firmicutes bacterium]|nr:ATP-binding protein [Bacillota bacterium]